MKKRWLAVALACSMLASSLTWGAPAAVKAEDILAAEAQASGIGVSDTKRSSYFADTARGNLFNDGWKFHVTNFKSAAEVTANGIDASKEGYDDFMWEDVELPHDYMISNGESEPDLYANSEAWYRKTFYVSEENRQKTAEIRFDGVYMNSTVYVNGKEVGTNPYGYTTFTFDISKYLNYGNEANTIAVKIVYQNPNSRWYSGAGIYRNVWLSFSNPLHVDTDGTYVSTDGKRNVIMDTQLVNRGTDDKTVRVRQTVVSDTGSSTAAAEDTITVKAGEPAKLTQEFAVENAKQWDIDDPNLYQIKTEVLEGNEIIDTYYTDFGFREVTFTTDQGVFLNGKHIKLNGVCMHHDLGALGAAVNYRALERQLQMMKDMGANAIRTTHNPADPAVIEICDRIGLLVVEEFTDMWKNPKNTYDYSVYFEEWAEHDLAGMVSRDRNHPSIIMWSIGNEISDTMNDASSGDEGAVKLAERLMDCAYANDSRRNGVVTAGSNYMKWGGQLAANVYKYAGYNYGEDTYDEHHAKYPDWYIYGSETSSAVRSRGIYHLPDTEGILTHMDEQCSSYDNSVVPWGRSAEDSWIQDRDRDYVLGQFVWTGFDYIGEPTPYSTKNSYFGIVDTAGIPKDIYYFYQSVWTDVQTNPMVHILPYWDWTEGETIPVYVYTNAPKVELFKDGVSLGVQEIDHANGSVLHAQWEVVYEEGTALTAQIYDAQGHEIVKDGKAVTETISSFGDPDVLSLVPDRTELSADGKDLIFVEVSTKDAAGNFVANARNRVEISVSGAGTLAGLDNGDSTDYEFYQSRNRKLFSGKMIAIIRSDGTDGDITVTAKSAGIRTSSIRLQAKAEKQNTEISVRGIDGLNSITEDGGSLKIEAVGTAGASYQKLNYTVTDTKGESTDAAVIDANGVLRAVKNGAVKVCAAAADGSGASAETEITISGQTDKTAAASVVIEGADKVDTPYGKIQLTAKVLPEQADSHVRWSVTEGKNAAELTQEGQLRAKADGTVTVRAAAADGSAVYAEKQITISNQTDAYVSVRKVEAELKEGGRELTAEQPEAQFTLKTYPANAVPDELYCEVSDTSLGSAQVDENGTLTVRGQADGVFTVTVGTKNKSRWIQAYQELDFTVSGLGQALKNPYTRVRGAEYDTASQAFNIEGEGALGGIYSRCWAGYCNYDFGRNGSHSIKIYAGTGEYQPQVDIYEGNPDDGGKLILTTNLTPTQTWNSETEQTIELQETLTGKKDIYFVLYGSIAFGGFEFVESDEIAPIQGAQYDSILGGYYETVEYTDADGGTHQALRVGNNTSVVYKNIKFGPKGADRVTFYAATAVDSCSIQLRYKDDSGQTVIESLNFIKTAEDGAAYEEQSFALSRPIEGIRDIELMYMPGNHMDLGWFRFGKAEEVNLDQILTELDGLKQQLKDMQEKLGQAETEAKAAKEAYENAAAQAEAAEEAAREAKEAYNNAVAEKNVYAEEAQKAKAAYEQAAADKNASEEEIKKAKAAYEQAVADKNAAEAEIKKAKEAYDKAQQEKEACAKEAQDAKTAYEQALQERDDWAKEAQKAKTLYEEAAAAAKRAEEAYEKMQVEKDGAVQAAAATKEAYEKALREKEETVKAALEEMQAMKQQMVRQERMLFAAGKVALKKVTSTKKQSIRVSWKKLSGADGYEIQYASNAGFKKAGTKAVKNKTAQTIKKLKGKKKYYVRVRAYKMIDGKKIYTRYSKKATVKIG